MKRNVFTARTLESLRAKREQQRQSRIESRMNAIKAQHTAVFEAASEIPAETLKKNVDSGDIALDIVAYIKGKYGEDCFKGDVCAGLWLAMQLIAGPADAAIAMRHFNFSDK